MYFFFQIIFIHYRNWIHQTHQTKQPKVSDMSFAFTWSAVFSYPEKVGVVFHMPESKIIISNEA